MRKYVLTFVAVVCFMVPVSTQHSNPEQISLANLVRRADRVVLGRVVDVAFDTYTVKVGKSAADFPVSLSTIEVESGFGTKGLQRGQKITLKQFEPLSRRMIPDQVVLLFLKKTNQHGFDSPVGDWAGDFIVKTRDSGERVARSTLGNRGLWAKDKTFWLGSDLNFALRVRRELHTRWPLAAERVVQAVDVIEIPDEIPIEFLLAAAASRFQPSR